MLLLIALANTPFYLYGRAHSDVGLHPLDGSAVDKVVQVVLITVVDLRVYPMFAFLFGYGLTMMYRRQRERGVPERDAFRLLQRRNLWLLAFGAVHALLLWGGDVLGAYGLSGLRIVWLFIRRTNRAMLIWAAVGTTLLALFAAFSVFSAWAILASGGDVQVDAGLPSFIHASASDPNALAAAISRALMWPVQILVVQGPIALVVPTSILLGSGPRGGGFSNGPASIVGCWQ